MQKSVSIRVDDDIYRECKKKLVDDKKTFTDLVKKAMSLYLEGALKLTEQKK